MANEDNLEPKTLRHDGCFDRFTKFPLPPAPVFESKNDLPDKLRKDNSKNAVIASKTKTEENPYGYLVTKLHQQVAKGCPAQDDYLVGTNVVAKIRVN